jgi:hypothetical protein
VGIDSYARGGGNWYQYKRCSIANSLVSIITTSSNATRLARIIGNRTKRYVAEAFGSNSPHASPEGKVGQIYLGLNGYRKMTNVAQKLIPSSITPNEAKKHTNSPRVVVAEANDSVITIGSGLAPSGFIAVKTSFLYGTDYRHQHMKFHLAFYASDIETRDAHTSSTSDGDKKSSLNTVFKDELTHRQQGDAFGPMSSKPASCSIAQQVGILGQMAGKTSETPVPSGRKAAVWSIHVVQKGDENILLDSYCIISSSAHESDVFRALSTQLGAAGARVMLDIDLSSSSASCSSIIRMPLFKIVTGKSRYPLPSPASTTTTTTAMQTMEELLKKSSCLTTFSIWLGEYT